VTTTSFRTWVPEDLADPHMQGPRVKTLLGAIGAQLDATAEQIMQARLQAVAFAGGPNAARTGAARLSDGRLIECDPIMLPLHGQQRGIRVYPTEPVLSRRVRISRWWQLHQRRGTHRGEMEHAQPYFLSLATTLPTIRIVHQPGDGASAYWHTLDPNGVYSLTRVAPSNFNYDGQTSKWARWFVFLDMTGTGIAGPPLYNAIGGHRYGDGTLYGVGGLPAGAFADIVSMFRDWKSARSWLAAVVLVWPPATLDPNGTPTQDADGRWSLPNGKWGRLVDPATGKGTRPIGYQWIYDNPG